MTSSARLRNPVSIPSNAWKKATASASTSVPMTLPIERSIGWAATLSTRRPRRVGIIISLNTGWSRKRASVRGRVEEVERVARRRRVDDDEVEALVAVQGEQPLGRHVLLRAAERAGDVAVEGVGRGSASPARRWPRWPRPGRRTSSPCRASTPTARRGRRSASRTGSLVKPPGTPSASASRLAGSIVTTTHRRPMRARPAARAPRPWWSCRRHPTRSTRRRRRSAISVVELAHGRSRRGRAASSLDRRRVSRPATASAAGGSAAERSVVGQPVRLVVDEARGGRCGTRPRRATREPASARRTGRSSPSSKALTTTGPRCTRLVLQRVGGLDRPR